MPSFQWPPVGSGGGGGSGDVVGPSSSVDNRIVRFDGTTGKIIQGSVVTLSDAGDLSGIAALSMSGTLTVGSLNGVVKAVSGVFSASAIVNADVSASAAIAYSKLALTGSIVNADVATGAAIAYSKLNLASSIVNADISASAAIAYSKLALTGSIVNADIGASAAIAYSKLAALTADRALVSSGVGVVAVSTVTATELGFLSGVTSAIQTQLNGKQNTGNYITALTGDVTAAGPGSVAATIANDAVTNAKLANMAQSTIKGRAVGAGTGDPTDLTAAQATAILDAYVGDTGAGGTKGLVPAPATGDRSKNLRGDGTWSWLNTVTASTTSSIDMQRDTVLASAASGSITLTLPTAVGVTGKTFKIKRTDSTVANTVTINTTSSQTIDGQTERVLADQHEQIEVMSDGSNWVILSQQCRRVVTITSSTLTPTGASIYHQFTGNSFTLTRGRWQLVGYMDNSNGGTNPNYSYAAAFFSAANGNNTGTPPAVLSTVSGVVTRSVEADQFHSPISNPLFNLNTINTTPIILDVTSAVSGSIFFNAFTVQSTSSAARITGRVTALKIGM